jgi:hypothetical protein
LRVQRSKPSGGFSVSADGRGLTSRSGTAAVAGLADELGLTGALVAAFDDGVTRRHDTGRVLRDLVVVLADGGDDFSAIEVLRGQPAVFGEVASDSTAWRAADRAAGDDLVTTKIDAARRAVRETAWSRGALPPAVAAVLDDPYAAAPVCVDLDATLVTAHSDKQGATGTYKRGFGHHPIGAWLDRGDGAGCTHAFLAYARHAGVGFSVGYRLGHAAARHAVRTLHDDDDAEWVPAAPRRHRPRRRRRGRGDRAGGSVGLAVRVAADRAPRAAAPRRATDPG